MNFNLTPFLYLTVFFFFSFFLKKSHLHSTTSRIWMFQQMHYARHEKEQNIFSFHRLFQIKWTDSWLSKHQIHSSLGKQCIFWGFRLYWAKNNEFTYKWYVRLDAHHYSSNAMNNWNNSLVTFPPFRIPIESNDHRKSMNNHKSKWHNGCNTEGN